MDITEEMLDGVVLTQRQKEAAFEAATKSAGGNFVNLPSDVKAAVKALKIVELQGGRPNCVKRFWCWLKA